MIMKRRGGVKHQKTGHQPRNEARSKSMFALCIEARAEPDAKARGAEEEFLFFDGRRTPPH